MRRFKILKPLFEIGRTERTFAKVSKIAAEFGKHPATIYRWIEDYERAEGPFRLRGARCRAEWVRLPKKELRHANIDSRFARNARIIAKTADPFNTPRQVVVRELIYCINRAPNQRIITDRLSKLANNVLPFALNPNVS